MCSAPVASVLSEAYAGEVRASASSPDVKNHPHLGARPDLRCVSHVEGTRGRPTDPGGPITHADVVEARLPAKNGFMAPAVQIR
ncbi:hypothetical protein GCM10010251_81840 [Streptomyces aurantiogriseus]|uniref:Uncharacterized protein n=1 Tax=Streptomyces aurantiogriseus TaxID=66870 RepID=A0A918KYY4_9ACTN|nr:hypothetical protein GCM10010251_81840 [Streptomyces aurantiogriseus]